MRNTITTNVDALMVMLKLMEFAGNVPCILSLILIELNAYVIEIIIGIHKEEHVIILLVLKTQNQFFLRKNTNVSVLRDISGTKINVIWILIVKITRYSLEHVFVKFLM